ncbi:MAG: hypothetical protein WAZ12_01105 [Candidatus Absconditicoccaceae bacterium]
MTKHKRHEKIYLPDQLNLIVSMGEILFDEMTETFRIQRGIDDRIRIGMHILLSEPDMPDNFVESPIYLPTDSDKALVNKQVELTKYLPTHYTDESICLMINCCGQKIRVSIAGLRAAENLVIATIVFSRVTRLSINYVIRQIEANGCKIPKEIRDENSYLYRILESYQ